MKYYELENGETLIIRKATKNDAAEILDCINKIAGESDFLTFGRDEFKISLDDQIKFIEDCSKGRNKLFIVAEINDKIVGNLVFTGGNNPRIFHVGEFGISVFKEYWGIGIGKKLIEYLIEWARGSQIVKKINLKVREDHKRAIDLYEKLGFRKEGITTRFFYQEGAFYSAVLMGLEIN